MSEGPETFSPNSLGCTTLHSRFVMAPLPTDELAACYARCAGGSAFLTDESGCLAYAYPADLPGDDLAPEGSRRRPPRWMA